MEAETKTGGFSVEEKAELKTSLEAVQTALETKNRETIKAELKTHTNTINEGIKKLTDWKGEKDTADKANQTAIDEMLLKIKSLNKGAERQEMKSVAEAMGDKIDEIADGIKSMRKGQPFKVVLEGPIDMSSKSVADHTLANALTGDSVITYNQRQALLPGQQTNFRDLVPTVHSDTGLYVTYRETGTQGAIALQTEGSGKSQIDYDFTNVQTVNKVLAGFARFSRQIAKSLPWLSNTLPRLMMRDFYMKENRYFYDRMATEAAAGGASTTTVETDDVKQIIDWVANLNQANFNASFGVLSFKAMAALNKLLYTNGYYQGSGGVLSNRDGSIVISGVPIIPVSWVPSNDKILLFDNSLVERVEVENITVAFSEEDANNFTENKITARVECYEELNVMLPSSVLLGDLGNSSTS